MSVRRDSARNRALLIEAAREVFAELTALFTRAQRAGVVRADAAPQDIAAIFAFLGPAFEMSRTVAPDLWRRYLALMLDGLRAVDRPALPAPPGLVSELASIMKAGKR
jgi:hypothetical protein